MLICVFDTMNLNALGKNQDLVAIEEYEKKKIIKIYYGADSRIDQENATEPGKSKWISKIGSKPNSFSGATLGYSKLGYTKCGGDSSNNLSKTIFNREWNELPFNEKTDMKILASAIDDVKANYFVTEETDILDKQKIVKEKFEIVILNRQNFRRYLDNLQKN